MNHIHLAHDKPATLTARASVPEDISYLAPRLSKGDLKSILASGSPSAEASLTNGFTYSDLCLTAVNPAGNSVLMFGTVPYQEDRTVASLWCLGTDETEIPAAMLLKETFRYLAIFHHKYPILSSFVDCRNTTRRRWLQSCGFEFGKTVPGRGPGGHPFQEATRIRIDQCVSH